MRNDLRYGLRALRRNPAVTITALVALALGISANTAMFSVADAFLFKPLALAEPDRLVMLLESQGSRPSGWASTAPANYADWKQQTKSFERLAASEWADINITGQGDPEGLLGSKVSADLFQTLGAKPLMGRVFIGDEDQAGRDQAAVLGYGLWQRRFAASPDIVGQTVHLDGKPYTVVGVMPKDFHFPTPAEIWIPLAMNEQERAIRGSRYLDVVAKLKPGVTVAQARAEMELVAKRLAASYPETNRGWHARVLPIRDFLIGDLTRNYTWMLLAAVGFVLLIACANVANLLFARATFRTKEIALRTALGASRWRIVRLLLIESLLLGFTGAAAAIVLGQWDVEMIRSNMPAEVGRFVSGWDKISLDGRTLLFTALLATLAGLMSGLAPALASSRPNLNEMLKEAVRGTSAGRSAGRLRSALLAGEIALALVLLVGAGLMVKGVHALIQVNQNLEPKSLLTMRLSLPEAKYKESRQIAAFYTQTLAALKTLPGVEAATLVTSVPYGDNDQSSRFAIEGRPAEVGELRTAQTQEISPNYFSTMRVALREGRAFTDRDGADTQPVALISQNFARRYWPNATPLGHKIKLGAADAPGRWLTIVGVVENVRYGWFDAEPAPAIYLPYMQSGKPYTYVALRTAGDPLTLVGAVRHRVAAIDAELPVFAVMTLDRVISESILGLSYVAVMMTVLGGIALVLACVGVYGVMAYAVSERTREMGIRIALGAERMDVLRAVVARGMLVTGIGLSIGFVISILLARVLASVIFGVSATDWQIFGGISFALASAAILACYLPARRATRIDPVVALRHE